MPFLYVFVFFIWRTKALCVSIFIFVFSVGIFSFCFSLPAYDKLDTGSVCFFYFLFFVSTLYTCVAFATFRVRSHHAITYICVCCLLYVSSYFLYLQHKYYSVCFCFCFLLFAKRRPLNRNFYIFLAVIYIIIIPAHWC